MKTLVKILKDQRGFTLMETLIGAVMGVIMLGVTIGVFTHQEDMLKDENDSTNIRAEGRRAIEELTQLIRMEGYGLPLNQGVTAMNSNSLSFRANLSNISTTTPPAGAGTFAAVSGSTAINVVSASTFSDNDNIVIFDPSVGTVDFNQVNGTPSASSIPLQNGLANNFIYGVNSNLILVNKYNQVTISQQGTNLVRTVDGVPQTIVGNLATQNGLQFNYYGAPNTASLYKIGVMLKLADPKNPNAVIEFKTDITLRNTVT
ncbi:MAG: PilW family protein [Nitrospinaceae bacterium]